MSFGEPWTGLDIAVATILHKEKNWGYRSVGNAIGRTHRAVYNALHNQKVIPTNEDWCMAEGYVHDIIHEKK